MRVHDIDGDESLTFVCDSQDVQAIKDSIGDQCVDCDSFFVEAVDGDYVRVYGIPGIVPHTYKRLHVHLEPEDRDPNDCPECARPCEHD